MRIVISAAVNQIGFFALGRAAALGMDVRATRRRRCFQTDPAPVTWQDAPDASDALVHSGPLRLAAGMVDRLGPNGLRAAVAFSSASIHFKGASTDPAEARMVGGLRQGEEDFARACERHGVSATILRPTLIYGCGLDENVSTLAAMLRRLPALPVPWGANGLRQPVHADDLADLALRAVQAARPGLTVLDAPGGERLGYRAMLRRPAAQPAPCLLAADCPPSPRALQARNSWPAWPMTSASMAGRRRACSAGRRADS